MSLVENSPQAKPTRIGVQFKRLYKIRIGKNGCYGAQALQVCWHLSFQVIATFVLPELLPDVRTNQQ